MTEMLFHPPGAVPTPRVTVRAALMESRERWRHLVSLAADLAFETDADGRFTLMMPDDLLGWPPGSLVGQRCEALIGSHAAETTLNPFRSAVDISRHRTWLRCADGRLALMAVSVTPLLDAAGRTVGARGIGIDITEQDADSSRIAGRLVREQALLHVLTCVGRATDTDSKLDSALWALIHALGAEGAAVIGAPGSDAGIEVLHECGPGATTILDAAGRLADSGSAEAACVTNSDGRLVLTVGCKTGFDPRAALTVWRKPGSRPWDAADTALTEAAVNIVRLILEHEALRRDMAQQARSDALTGLLTRHAFIEEIERQIARLDRESEAGTLMFVDVDAFKAVNDRLGHATGDQVLVHVANMLRRLVRPFDVITRLGGDEFAVWLSGADHMTAAERADHLCKIAPGELQEMLPQPCPKLGLSVGIATRRSGSLETIEELLKRADMAMFEVKRSGRRHWRVSLLDGDS